MAERMKNPAMITRILNRRVLGIAKRGHVPVFGVVYHRGRRSGRPYATPAWSGQAAPNTRPPTPRSSTRRRPERT